MRRSLIACLLLLWCYSKTYTQPTTCDVDNPEMTSTCVEACIICDIDGFTGRHESNVVGSLPGDFCTFVVHNAQWIAFQAASTELKIRLTVSNCIQGNGLEMAIYRSLDCNSFEMISNCRGGTNPVPEGTSAEFTTNEPLVIGQYYYLAMDGNIGDNCDWTFEVLEGSTEVAPLTVTAPIAGVDEICPEIETTFTTEPEEGAVIFNWTVNGQPVGDNTSPELSYSFPAPGSYTLCVQASNACDEADSVCKLIEVISIPPTEINDFFCSGDCYELDGNNYCEPGTYTYDILLPNGCDSTIILNLTEIEQPVNDIVVNICEGDTLVVGTTPYTETGQFTETLLSAFLCDSIVNLDLTIILCTINTLQTTTSTICHNGSDGTANFMVENGTPPFTYSWQHLQTGLSGTGAISGLSESITLTDLPAGELIIQIDDNFGNSDVIITEIVEPEPIVMNATITDYNGFNTTCADAMDGGIDLQVSGGISPYQYQWSTGEITSSLVQLSAGDYAITLTDDLGCRQTNTLTITEPDSISAQIDFINPNCDGLETGLVEVGAVNGGSGDYVFSLNNSPFTNQFSYPQLFPGIYSLEILDGNSCSYLKTEELTAPEIPVLSGKTDYQTQLGCEVTLSTALNNIDIQELIWIPAEGLSCGDCLSPVALPLANANNYTLFVASRDGCVDSLHIKITVEKERAFYAPNAFSPNFDGINDRFFLMGGKEVGTIDLAIYDRWGNFIFEALQMAPEDPLNGWDGTFRGEVVDTGVFTWVAKVNFIDGITNTYTGDFMLLGAN